jgi:hypothetical protein
MNRKSIEEAKIFIGELNGLHPLPPPCPLPPEVSRRVKVLTLIMDEEKKILADEKAEDAARKLVRACLEANSEIAAESGLTSAERVRLALCALAEDIAFIARKIALQSTSPGKRWKKKEGEKFAKALRNLRDIDPSALSVSPVWIETIIGCFGPKFRGAPGRPRLGIKDISISLKQYHVHLFGKPGHNVTKSLLAASSAADDLNLSGGGKEQIRDLIRK